MNRPKTKILLDGGDPDQSAKIKELLGFLDGQTTNPTLVARNPEIAAMVAAGQKMSRSEANEHYKKIVQSIAPFVGDSGVSIEVFSDRDTKVEEMFSQAKDMNTWVPNAYIKYPCTHEGLKAAKMSIDAGMKVNITLCFSQQQAAAVYAVTKGSIFPCYVSPFVGRLDDNGQNGMDLIKNINQMFKGSDGHVKVLAASIRNLSQMMYALSLQTDMITAPMKVLEAWATSGMQIPAEGFSYAPEAQGVQAIPYEEVDLNQDWESYNLQHPLTDVGIDKFVVDYRNTIHD
jgi:transaldolase